MSAGIVLGRQTATLLFLVECGDEFLNQFDHLVGIVFVFDCLRNFTPAFLGRTKFVLRFDNPRISFHRTVVRKFFCNVFYGLD